MKKCIKKMILKLAKKEIKQVLNGKKECAELPFVRPHHVESILKNMDNIEVERTDFESNSWAWDYWLYYIIDGEKYTLSGDGFYRTNCEFRKYE